MDIVRVEGKVVNVEEMKAKTAGKASHYKIAVEDERLKTGMPSIAFVKSWENGVKKGQDVKFRCEVRAWVSKGGRVGADLWLIG